MAIVNATPDSFSDEQHLMTEEAILDAVSKHMAEGADILDIGGYSTRPGAPEVSEEEEWRRVRMAASAIRRVYPEAVLSVDTFRASVAEKAVCECGVDIVNDISGGTLDPDMFGLVARLGVPYILTHTRGTPATMASLTCYDNLVADMMAFFDEKIAHLQRLGAKDIILDPGFGFAKTLEQNYQLLGHMHEFEAFSLPILAGISRKSMIYKPLGITPQEAQNGTTALHMVALEQGASILRVHHVREARQAITLHQLLIVNC